MRKIAKTLNIVTINDVKAFTVIITSLALLSCLESIVEHIL